MANTEQLRIHSRSWVSFSPGETERDLKTVACQQVQYIGLASRQSCKASLRPRFFAVTLETLEIPACTNPLEMHASLRLHALGMRSHLHRRINSRLATLQCSRDLAKPNTVIHVRIEYYVLVVDKIIERDCIICILHK